MPDTNRPRWERWRARLQRSALAFPLAVGVAVLMLTTSEIAHRQTASQLSALVARGQARLELSHLVRSLSDAESSQRGYLLTGQADYLAPYHNASTGALNSVAKLRGLYDKMAAPADSEHSAAGDPSATLEALARDVHIRLSEMDEVLALCQRARCDAARALVQAGFGRDAMARIRALTDTLLDGQNTRVIAGLDRLFDTLLLNRVGVAALTAMGLLLLGLYLRQVRQRDRERHAQQRQLRQERDRLEAEVSVRTAELTQLARHLETTREDERARLARDLHDELGALLTAAKLDLARMRPKLAQTAPDMLPRIAHLAEALNNGIALKRRIIEDLRPSSLSTLGLGPALEILYKDFAERSGLQIDAQLSPVALTPSSELTVFRLVQESLNNIAKHAQAKRVQLSMRPLANSPISGRDGAEAGDRSGEHEPQPIAAGGHGTVEVCISDDGVGFATGQVGVARHGLVGMRYRVQAEGGVLTVTSQPGRGTVVHASLPAASSAG